MSCIQSFSTFQSSNQNSFKDNIFLSFTLEQVMQTADSKNWRAVQEDEGEQCKWMNPFCEFSNEISQINILPELNNLM